MEGAAALPCRNSHNSGFTAEDAAGWKTPEQLESAEGAARRRAFKLRHDMAGFLKAVGLERVLMLELTHGRDGPKQLARKWDRLAKNGGLPWLRDWGCITEPHKSGAAHFHFVIEAPEGLDVRTGFDFAALGRADAAAQARDWAECQRWTKAYSASAHSWLRTQWLRLRTLSRRYGFGGRCRLVPVRTCGEAVAHYVAKYLSKCLANDLGPAWKRVRRVEWARKAGFKPRRKVSSQFAWAGIISGHGRKHRQRLDQIARALGLGPDDMEGLRRVAGPRWAYRWREQLRGTDEEFDHFLR